MIKERQITMGNIIEVKDFYKNYGDVQAVKGISFQVKEGSSFAFLGPNGAGKSTTIDTLCTLIKCEHGDIKINGLKLGKEDDQIRKHIGVVFQNSVLDEFLTIKENLVQRGSFYKMTKEEINHRIEYVSKVTGVSDLLARRYGKLSGGQKRRADIARAIIHAPKILFLDEPTTGLDPKTRRSIWESISSMQKELGMTVFLTTHYMEEAASADEVVVIKEGRIVEYGSPAFLKNKYTKDHLILYSNDIEVENYIKRLKREYVKKTDVLKLEIHDKDDAMKLLNEISEKVESFEVIKGNMDAVFLNIIGTQEEAECEY